MGQFDACSRRPGTASCQAGRSGRAGFSAWIGAVMHTGIASVFKVPTAIGALMRHKPGDAAIDRLFALYCAAAVMCPFTATTRRATAEIAMQPIALRAKLDSTSARFSASVVGAAGVCACVGANEV